jgi:hypothetical protein
VLGCGQNKARQTAEEAVQKQAQYDRLLSQANKDLEGGGMMKRSNPPKRP